MPASPRTLAPAFALLLAFAGGLYGLSRLLHQEPGPPRTAGVVDWSAGLAAISDEGFERPSGAWELRLPGDHGAHAKTRMEAWNIAAHLRNDRDEDLGFQFSLLRVGIVPPDAPGPESAWALRELYRGHVALLDGPQGRAAGEERFGRAVLGLAGYDATLQEVRLDDWSLRFGNGERQDQLRLDATVDASEVELLFTPAKAAVASGPDGGGAAVRGYSITRMVVQGFVAARGDRQPVSGLAWLDHGWGELPLPGSPIAWDQLQLQLDDGTDVSLTRARRRAGGGTATLDGYAVRPGGRVERLDGASLRMEPSRIWRRDHAGASYPVDWRLDGGELDLRVTALVDDQIHDFAAPLWSGMVTAEGRLGDRRVSGVGTLLLTGYAGQ